MARTGETSGQCRRKALRFLERQIEERGAALRECEDRLRDIAELSGEWAWETDSEHRFVEIFGDSAPRAAVRKGIVGRTRWEVAGADPRTDPDWGRHKADLDARRPFRRFRYAVDTAEGGRMLMLWSGKPLFDAQGNFAGYRGTARDETAQAEARERREAAERLLREAIEGIAGGIAIWDGEERLVLCNETYRRMYPDGAPWIVRGIGFEEALRRGLARGHYPEAVGREEEWIAARLRAQRSLEDASELQLSDGRWVLSTKRRMPRGWVAALRIDVTALKRTQMALRESRDSLERAQRVAHIGSMSRSLATDEAVWSQEAFRIFGVEPESFQPTTDNMLRLVHPDDRAIVHELQARGRRGLDPGPFECRILRPDGRERLVRGEGLMMRDERGEPLWVTATVQDITEARAAQRRERELEQQLAQSQKMEAIGNLTGGMAHDFNNLLGVVIGNLDLVRERLAADPQTAEIVEEALEAAWRGADLTRRLLAFARRQPLRPATIDVNALVGNTVRLLQRLLGEDIEIGLGLAEDIWPVVADPAQLEASLANLATNARDAMPGGGRLSISTGSRVLDADYAARNPDVTPGEYVSIAVSDTGAGMSQETVERIFEPFFTTKGPGKGTGLGLSMVFGFLKQSKGHVSVYSEEGVGTTFRLYLPRAYPEAAPQAAAPVRTAERGAGERVLVVEDDLAVRRVVVRQLGDLGYGVAAVDRAAAALELLARETFDVLFTDIVMPGGLDGVELARLAREKWPALKVLLTSGVPPACCWAYWFTAMRRGCFRAASWSGRPTIRWRSATSLPMITRIMTRSRRSGGGFCRRSSGCSSRHCCWRARWGGLKLGTVALDGTKIHANASRHRALSYAHAGELEGQLQGEVRVLLAQAEAADQADVPDGMSIPEELERREERLRRLAAARRQIEARANERLAREQAEYEAKIAAREAKARASGKKPGGRPPAPGPGPSDQINLTDPDSRIMPVAGGGFEQSYNAQAAVTAGSLLVVASDVVQAANDKQQLAPMLGKLTALPEALGGLQALLADSGYCNAANVAACGRAGIAPLLALGRTPHHPSLAERYAAAPPAPEHPAPLEAMAHRLATPAGKKLYALRKHTPEPVFGIIKSVLGFRQFSLRGLDKVRGEWRLVTMAWNLKRLFALAAR